MRHIEGSLLLLTSLSLYLGAPKPALPEELPPVVPCSNGTSSGQREELPSDSLRPRGKLRPANPSGPWNDAARRYQPLRPSDRENLIATVSADCQQAYDALGDELDKPLATKLHVSLDNVAEWYVGLSLDARQRGKPILDALHAYDHACLIQGIPPYVPEQDIRSAVGVFGVDALVRCTGLRFSPNKVLTARHCLFDNSNRPLPLTSMWFRYETKATSRFMVCAVEPPGVDNLAPASMKDDYVVLTIANSNDPAPKLEFDDTALETGTPLFLLGYDVLASPSSSTDLQLRSTNARGCVVALDTHGCLFHACQAMQGASGAPIFRVPNPLPPAGIAYPLRVVGLHLGTQTLKTSNAAGCALEANVLSDTSNVGFRLPSLPPFH